MDEQYYALRLWCPATPPFVSADRIHIASASEMQKAMDAMDDSECCQETVKAYKRYMSGDETATHNIAYRDIPVLEKVDLICTSIILIGEHQWEHINSWGYSYEMKCDSAEVKRIVVKYDNQYLRCYKITFKNLYTEIVDGEWQKLNHFFSEIIFCWMSNIRQTMTLRSRPSCMKRKAYTTLWKKPMRSTEMIILTSDSFVMRYSVTVDGKHEENR